MRHPLLFVSIASIALLLAGCSHLVTRPYSLEAGRYTLEIKQLEPTLEVVEIECIVKPGGHKVEFTNLRSGFPILCGTITRNWFIAPLSFHDSRLYGIATYTGDLDGNNIIRGTFKGRNVYPRNYDENLNSPENVYKYSGEFSVYPSEASLRKSLGFLAVAEYGEPELMIGLTNLRVFIDKGGKVGMVDSGDPTDVEFGKQVQHLDMADLFKEADKISINGPVLIYAHKRAMFEPVKKLCEAFSGRFDQFRLMALHPKWESAVMLPFRLEGNDINPPPGDLKINHRLVVTKMSYQLFKGSEKAETFPHNDLDRKLSSYFPQKDPHSSRVSSILIRASSDMTVKDLSEIMGILYKHNIMPSLETVKTVPNVETEQEDTGSEEPNP